MDKTSIIFGNPIDKKTIKNAQKTKKKYIKKYGDDSDKEYYLTTEPIKTLDFINVDNLVFSDKKVTLEDNALIVGNIRMGFGHYRISIAMASCARAMGYKPYWLDLASFDATGSKMIREQNNMYSLASKISQKSVLFNKIIWEPLNSEGFRKLTYNAKDQKNSELLVPILKNLDKDVPYIATHVWPSQAAIHAGFTHVVNAIPDNWPMGLHLSEGAIHTVQTPHAYLGYKMLNGFGKKPLLSMPDDSLYMVGHFIDHELVSNLEQDNNHRLNRIKNNKPLRLLFTVGGAGAGFDMFAAMIEYLKPYVEDNKVTLFINFGDHKDVYEKLLKKVKGINAKTFFNEYDKLTGFAKNANDSDVTGIYAIYNKDIFEAVYSTNMLMRVSDILVTKPSELAYYPIPKLFMRHIGGHEVYGAINSVELGDGTFECSTKKSVCEMLSRLINDKDILSHFVHRINELKSQGYYNGGYECVKLAVKGK